MTIVPTPVSGKAVDAAAAFFERFGGISRFIESILNVPAGYLQQWAQANLIRWHDKYQAENAKRRTDGRELIPPSLLMPALQRIAIEDDDDMLAIWARLFANFQDPNRRLDPNKLYVHLLSEMQPLDFKLLQYIAVVLPQRQSAPRTINDKPMEIHRIAAALSVEAPGLPAPDVILSLHNLHRLGCLLGASGDTVWVSSGSMLADVPSVVGDNGIFHLTSLGTSIIKACSEATLPKESGSCR